MDPVKANSIRLRPVQIIIVALCLGLVLFGAVVGYLVRPGQQSGWFVASPDKLDWIAKALLFAGVVAGIVLWRMARTKARDAANGLVEDRARDALLPLFQTGLITRAALIEGPGLFCIVVALLYHDVWMLAWGGVSVAGLIAIFPTWATYERFVQDALRRK